MENIVVLHGGSAEFLKNIFTSAARVLFYAPLVRINNIYFIFPALWLSWYELNVKLHSGFCHY